MLRPKPSYFCHFFWSLAKVIQYHSQFRIRQCAQGVYFIIVLWADFLEQSAQYYTKVDSLNVQKAFINLGRDFFWKRNSLIPSNFPLSRETKTKKAEIFQNFNSWMIEFKVIQRNAIWHLAICQNLCLVQSYQSKI